MDRLHHQLADAYRKILKESEVGPSDAMSAGPYLQDFKDNPKTSAYYPFSVFHKEKGKRKHFKKEEHMKRFLTGNLLWSPVLEKDDDFHDDPTNETPDGNEGEA